MRIVSRTAMISWRSSTCVAMVLLLATVFTHANAQSGFLSLDCGAAEGSYFDSTGLYWLPDTSNYVGTGSSMNVSSQFLPVNESLAYRALNDFRYFPENRSKHCYELQIAGSPLLIRTFFYWGNTSDILPLPILFNVSIDGTIVFSVNVTDDDDPTFDETIWQSTRSFIYLCLLPITGIPFISSIELRTLQVDSRGLYLSGTQDYFQIFMRANCGAGNDTTVDNIVRYPDDKFDRLWIPSSQYFNNDTTKFDVTSGAVSLSSNSTVNSVPPLVMTNAWQYQGGSPNNSNAIGDTFYFYIPMDLLDTTVNSLYVAIYIENLSSGSERNINVSFNGEHEVIINAGFDTLGNIPTVNMALDANMSAHGGPNVSGLFFNLTALSGSTLGPIVNAFEIYYIYSFENTTTSPTDVQALVSVKENFNLTDWRGDPCLPVAWNWIECDNNSDIRRVTKLLLSSSNISGSIPPEISTMNALTEIHLDNNSLTGTIPLSLASIPNLTVLSLNNNKLTGKVPSVLKDKQPGLKLTTYNNNFDHANKRKIIGASIGGVLSFLLIIAGLLLIWNLQRKGKSLQAPYRPPGGDVTLRAVLLATNNHSNKIGVGSYGSVYHGNLDGTEVAVKVNGIHSDQRNQEFITEVDILTRVHHKNLVSLLGYCNEGQQLILIYEYQANGTLREWLHTGDESKAPLRGFLDWPKRLQIAVDAAKGLEYLHKSCVPPIIHRDVKTSNILLDDNLTGKVADFGVSKTTLRRANAVDSVTNFIEHQPLPSSDTFDDSSGGFFTKIKGTPGYLDPEYLQTGILTARCDVYSFGVVLAELISGQPAIKRVKGSPTGVNLLTELYKALEDGHLETIVDPRLGTEYNMESMYKVANVALACVQNNGEQRPDISDIVRNLDLASRVNNQETFSLNYEPPAVSYPSSFHVSGNSSSISGLQSSTTMSTTASLSSANSTTELVALDKNRRDASSHSVRWGSVTKYY